MTHSSKMINKYQPIDDMDARIKIQGLNVAIGVILKEIDNNIVKSKKAINLKKRNRECFMRVTWKLNSLKQ